MPAPVPAVQLYGTLPNFDRQEFAETGFLTQTVSFTPEQEIKKKKKHSPGELGQTGQIQIWRGDLAIELKGDIIPNADGLVHGLPASYVGQAITACAHFAAATEGPNPIPALERHGYTRDPNKLLFISSAKTDLGEDAPNCTIGMTYVPTVSKDPIALLA
ncbi:hypothetical protein [Prosthecobacter dejongeii]|uniref:Uncharacterized protein n=1 Tax=Prosthecobacter dejongeii TaxID=48465 RepID=A0A7W7YLR1_9BACT|nr:hypothetical protein [Prosthecobacter dejongeii]MBB5038265.1 hypothetical protein [Prosthecobacter dejongeii]